MSKPKVLLLGKVLFAGDAWDNFARRVDVVHPRAINREEFIAECQSGALDGIFALYRAAETVAGKFDTDLVRALPASLKFVCYTGAGYDSIDVGACTNAGIQVSNVRAAVDDATADTTVFLMLGAFRLFNPHIFSLRQGNWMADCPMGIDPQGKILGILGMGGVGKAVAARARVMGMKVQYHNRSRPSQPLVGCDYVNFDELLESANVLVLTLPLNDKTYHIISKSAFDKMKTGVTIVNVARGKVMDESALVEALECGKVWSAGLDVFENEPRVHPRLLENPRVMLVPHVGTYTQGTKRRMEEWAISNLEAALETGRLHNRVPEQANTTFGNV